MSHPTETASLPLGQRWAPSIDEVRQGGIDRRLSQAASPHLHPPRRATPSHDEAGSLRTSRWGEDCTLPGIQAGVVVPADRLARM